MNLRFCSLVPVVAFGLVTSGVLAGCGGSAPAAKNAEPAPAKSESAEPSEEPAAPQTDGAKEKESSAPGPAVENAPLPCPGKNAKYWPTGLVKSEVLTADCSINGHDLKAGALLQFDENGQMFAD